MLIDMFRSIDKDFVAKEEQAMLQDTIGYAESIMETIKVRGPSRTTGTIISILEDDRGKEAITGFLFTLNLLQRWSKTRSEIQGSNWLKTQYCRIDNMGSAMAREYVTEFIMYQQKNVERLSSLLIGRSPLHLFTRHGESKWTNFSIGAYLLIGILLKAEEDEIRTLVLTE